MVFIGGKHGPDVDIPCLCPVVADAVNSIDIISGPRTVADIVKVEIEKCINFPVTLEFPVKPAVNLWKIAQKTGNAAGELCNCLLYTSPSPRDQRGSRMPSSA